MFYLSSKCYLNQIEYTTQLHSNNSNANCMNGNVTQANQTEMSREIWTRTSQFVSSLLDLYSDIRRKDDKPDPYPQIAIGHCKHEVKYARFGLSEFAQIRPRY